MTEIWAHPHWPRFIYDSKGLASLVATASEDMGRVHGLHEGLSASEREHILLSEITQEAVHSFAIEGVTLDPAEVAESVVRSMASRNLTGAARRSDSVAQIMLEAREATTRLTPAVLHRWHRLLFAGMEVEDLGRWRRFDLNIVKSHRADREEILYTAPPPARINTDMARWFDALATGQGGQPLPVFAGLMHLWFESIHPYSDGNGRLGRAVTEYCFARAQALPFSLSRQVEADKRAYYDALQAGRVIGEGGIDATAFLEWFLRTLICAATRARDEARFLLRRNRFFTDNSPRLNPRQEKMLRKLFDGGQDRLSQGISAKSYVKITGTSPATATRDLTDLADKGILTRAEGAGGRSTWYEVVW